MTAEHFYVTHTKIGGSLVLEKKWGGVGVGAVFKSAWLMDADGATTFLSEEDAWAGFDRSGMGARTDFAVLPMEAAQ